MARVFRVPDGYQFVRLSSIGKQLVNEFQRHHPKLVEPVEEPGSRFIHLGSAEQNLELEELVANVLKRDPESVWEPKPPRRHGGE